MRTTRRRLDALHPGLPSLSRWKPLALAIAGTAVTALVSPVYGQDNRPPGAAPDTAPRPLDPAAAPPNVPPPPPTTGAPLPPLPPAGPSEPPSAEAPPPPPPPPPRDRPRRPWFGGLGYVIVGPFFGDLSTLDTALSQSDALGASYGIGRSALTLGGGGGAVLFGHLWLGGHGAGLLTAPFKNARGEAILRGGGGGFEVGYVLAYPRMLVIPFCAVGGFAYDLEVTNRSGAAMPLQQVLTLAAGDSRHFTAGFATVELGARVQRLLFSGHGGFTGGFEVGLMRSLSAAPWKSDRYEFTDHKGAIIDGVYARVTFGGGGFFFR